ncbi:MAG TPA: hypothetical protein VK184_19280 [Nostocaceae cyanobacterium]|nr:hypothetical protein [Nostocaceae cyanobacterium]
MTNQKFLEILHSWDVDSLLTDIHWKNIKEPADIWDKLFTVLSHLSNNQKYLRNISGELSVITCADEQSISQPTDEEWQDWSVIVTPEGLQKLREIYNNACASINYVVPSRILLRTEAVVLLPAEVEEVKITAIDVGDMEWGTLKLEEDKTIDAPEGFKVWWTANDYDKPIDSSVIYIEFYCYREQGEDYQMFFSLDSDYDIFRPVHFDAIPNDRHGVLTFQWHMSYLQQLALNTGGKLDIYPDLIDYFPVEK